MLMRETAKELDWHLNYASIARIWRGGCIIKVRIDYTPFIISGVPIHRLFAVRFPRRYYLGVREKSEP